MSDNGAIRHELNTVAGVPRETVQLDVSFQRLRLDIRWTRVI